MRMRIIMVVEETIGKFLAKDQKLVNYAMLNKYKGLKCMYALALLIYPVDSITRYGV